MIPAGVLGSARVAAGGGSLTGAYLQATSTGVDAATYTFAAQAIGAADATRVVVVTVTARKAAPAATVTSVTIGGVTATLGAQVSQNGNTTAIYYAAVPTGTTADVVVNWSATVLRCGLGMWALTGAAVSVTTNTATSTGSSAGAIVTGSAGGFIIAGACCATALTATWAGATERYDAAIGAEAAAHSGADSTATGSVTPTVTWSANGDTPVVVAAFAPA